jgi:hypothetical protein
MDPNTLVFFVSLQQLFNLNVCLSSLHVTDALQGTAPQLLDALMAHPLYSVMLIKQLDLGTASTPRSPLEKALHSLMLDLGIDADTYRWAPARAKGA